jgi:hypothetical protein
MIQLFILLLTYELIDEVYKGGFSSNEKNNINSYHPSFYGEFINGR